MREDYNLFIEKGVKDLPFDIFFQNRDTDPNVTLWSHFVEARLRDRFSDWTSTRNDPRYECVNWQNGLQIDFFVYDYDSKNNWISNNYERILSNARIHIELDEIEYLDTIIFEGHEYFIPVGYDTYLKRCYGDYMKLPPIGEQQELPDVNIFNSHDHPASLNWKDFY